VRAGKTLQIPVTLRAYPLAENLRQDWGAMVYASLMFLIGAFVFYKRPAVPAARVQLLGGSAILGATTWSFGLQALDFAYPLTFFLHRITTSGVYLLFWASILHFSLIFPNPHRLVQRHRWLVPALYIAPFLVLMLALSGAHFAAVNTLDWLSRLGPEQNVTVTVYLVLVLLALITNYLDQSDTVSRQQIRVVVYALSLNGILGILLWQVPQLIYGEQKFSSNHIALVGLIVPIAQTIAIVRYRLWDIDIIINRTAVYGLLSMLVVGLYVTLVGMMGALFEQHTSQVFSLIATGVIALIFQPLRARLQHIVNRMMYGERDTPYQVVSRLGRQLEYSAAPEELLDTITQTIAQALKLPFAGIALLENGALTMLSEYGRRPAEPLVLPLIYQREAVGQLTVAPRGPHDPLTAPDLRLLEDIAHQTGAVVHAVRLNRDLQRSRERLVIRLEEERRRLRRDLHDGLGSTLASYMLKLDAILDLIDSDPAQAKAQIDVLKQQTKEAVKDIRRLVYELRPPALDELGLLEALHAHLGQINNAGGAPHIILRVPPEGLPSLSAAVAVAAYRIVMESVTNVLHHAAASTCHVHLRIEPRPEGFRKGSPCATLCLEIIDNGVGLPETLHAGVGLVSMRERALELGGACTIENNSDGGTRVWVTLPIDEQAN
jgi:signal transduction histidine kinase